MTAGLGNLKLIVVPMMENRPLGHMLGGLRKQDRRSNRLTGNESNLDTTNEPVKAQYQGQLDPDPGHQFPAVHPHHASIPATVTKQFIGNTSPPSPGGLASAFAVSMAAPFWFGVLNKISFVRSTVKPQETQK